jgi:hypothetical protein
MSSHRLSAVRRAALAALIAPALLGAAPAAANAALTIDVGRGGFVVRLGSLDIRTGAMLADATRAFGRPSRVSPGDDVCVVRWSRVKLVTRFTSFGGVSDFCRQGFLQTAVTHSRRWRTWKGLRVGMPTSQVRERHPKARFRRGRWVLASQSVLGGTPSPTVEAMVRGGRVSGFSLWVGAAGD